MPLSMRKNIKSGLLLIMTVLWVTSTLFADARIYALGKAKVLAVKYIQNGEFAITLSKIPDRSTEMMSVFFNDKPEISFREYSLFTRDSIFEYFGEVTVAPITSTVRDIPSEVFLSKQDGMAKDCAINLDHIQTVSKGKIGSLLTTLSADKLDRVSEAIQFALNAWEENE